MDYDKKITYSFTTHSKVNLVTGEMFTFYIRINQVDVVCWELVENIRRFKSDFKSLELWGNECHLEFNSWESKTIFFMFRWACFIRWTTPPKHIAEETQKVEHLFEIFHIHPLIWQIKITSSIPWVSPVILYYSNYGSSQWV